jgi:glycosyltransferase involved in cell wall biosynthesis
VAGGDHGAVVLHDRFQFRGGGERVVMDIAAALDATIVTEYWDPENSYARDEVGVPILTLGRPIGLPGFWFLAPCFRFWRFARTLRGPRLIVFSGSSCLAAARRHKGSLRILYCHSPPRFAFDQTDFATALRPPLLRPLFRIFAAGVRGWYRRRLNDVDLVLCASKTIQERLLRCCGREAQILTPGITLSSAPPAAGEYYLSFARLDPLKRVEAIVEAFVGMPDLPLVVASTGPCEQALRKRAAHAPNIRFVGALTDAELREVIRRCIAAIYIPIEEDFGLTPLEAAAIGKPTIGVAEGGLRETILDGDTGILLPPSFSRDDLAHAVRSLGAERAEAMRAACLRQAERFGKDRFARSLQALVRERQARVP